MAKKRLDVDEIETRFLPVEDQEEADQKYQAVVAYCQDSDTTFRDGEFPVEKFPAKDWMVKRGLRFVTGGYKHPKEWTRPVEYAFCGHVLSLPVEHPDYESIPVYMSIMDYKILEEPSLENLSQCGLGDCGLISAMGSLVEFPEVLNAVFPRKELSEHGVYEVRLWVFGEWKRVLVDDYFITQHHLVDVAHSADRQLWPTLIEKAIAKVFGGYLKIIGISSAVSFRMLTGQPAMQHYTPLMTDDELWGVMTSAKSNRYPMCAGSKHTRNVLMKRMAIFQSHAYSLIDVKEWRGCRLVRVRNNYGLREMEAKWKFEKDSGKVSNESDLVELNGKLGAIIGSTWLELEQFRECFSLVTVCRLRPSWTSVAVNTVISGLIDNRNKAIQIIVPETTEVCFSALDPKGVHGYVKNALLCLWQLEEGTGDVGDIIHCFFITKTSATEDVRLERGTYILFPTDLIWHKTERNIVVHSSKPVRARLVPLNTTMLTDAFQKFVHRFGHEIPLNRPEIDPKVVIKKCWISNRLFVMMAENYSKNEYLHVRMYLERGTRFFLRQTANDALFVDKQVDVLPPMSRQILLTQYERYGEKKNEKGINIEYFFSSDKFTTVWDMDKTQHWPVIDSQLYIFHTLAIEENESI